jgi:DNA-binding PadR family transcriptional regulator
MNEGDAEVMDAWRTSCPRFPVREDLNDRGLVTKKQMNGRRYVRITSSGLALLDQRRFPRELNMTDELIEMKVSIHDITDDP